MNINTGLPILTNIEDDQEDDPVYHIKDLSTAEKLLETWKKGQRHLDTLWRLWKDQYLLSLRERSQKHLKSPRVQSLKKPEVGDVVQIKENLPRGAWKVGKILELISNTDGIERAAKILLPSKNIINRSLNMLYPLECEVVVNKEAKEESNKEDSNQREEQDDQPEVNSNDDKNNRPRRKAAENARKKLRELFNDEISTFIWCPECRDPRTL